MTNTVRLPGAVGISNNKNAKNTPCCRRAQLNTIGMEKRKEFRDYFKYDQFLRSTDRPDDDRREEATIRVQQVAVPGGIDDGDGTNVADTESADGSANDGDDGTSGTASDPAPGCDGRDDDAAGSQQQQQVFSVRKPPSPPVHIRFRAFLNESFFYHTPSFFYFFTCIRCRVDSILCHRENNTFFSTLGPNAFSGIPFRSARNGGPTFRTYMVATPFGI